MRSAPRAAAPQGLWAETAGLDAAPADAPQQDETTDVAIIGGGFCGLSAALHLAERSIAVTVLEAETAGWGASGRNGGQVIAGLKRDKRELIAAYGAARGEALHRFGSGTADLVFGLIERFQIRCEAHRDGWLQAARSEAVLRATAARARALQAAGEDVVLLEAPEVAVLTGTPFYRGAMLDRRSGSVQPLSYARGLAAAAVALGARIEHGQRVVALSREAGCWLVRTVSGRTVRARHVLIAANADVASIYPALRTAMIAVQSIQVATAPLPPEQDALVLPSRLPVSDLIDLGVYFRRDDAGRFVIGGRGALHGEASDGMFGTLTRTARLLFPLLQSADFVVRWGGRLALTPDHLPRLLAPEPGLFVAYGCNGRGVALMTALGRLAAARIAGEPVVTDLPIETETPARYPFHALRLPAMMAVARVRRLRRALVRS